MTNFKNTKTALVSSVVALLICFSMLLGTTYAWFTDIVTSSGNIIKAGDLEVMMEFADGTLDPASANTTWANADGVAIFNYDNWEPGYVEVHHIKISNVGTLAFKYQVSIAANGVISKLAEVIDVYYVDPAVQVDERADLIDRYKLGTLAEVLGQIPDTASGKLIPDESHTITIALKMQESAGNDYQGLSIGTDFSIQLVASQVPYEEDSFGDDYDNDVLDSNLPPAAVTYIDGIIDHDRYRDGAFVETVRVVDVDNQGNRIIKYTEGINGTEKVGILTVGYQFEPDCTYEEATASEYRYWHADFVVESNKEIPAEALALAGYYDAWCELNDDRWVALSSSEAIAANTKIRLVETLGATVNWEEICEFGNDNLGFVCGLMKLGELEAGTTITVELRIYETTGDPTTEDGPKNIETGEYITIGTFTYTFE